MLARRLFLAGLFAVPIAAHARETVQETLRSERTPVAPAGPDADALRLGGDAGNRLTVPVIVNGKGPFDFLVDTAAERSVLSRELAERLGLPIGGMARLHGIAGIETVEMVRVATFDFGALSSTGLEPLVLPWNRLEIDGVLGLDVLAERCVVLDYRGRTMTITPSRWKRPGASAARGEATIAGLSRLGQLTFVDCNVDGTRIHAFIDSGAQASIGNEALASAIGAFRPTLGEAAEPIALQGATGQTVFARLGRAGRFQLGPVEFRNMDLLFADLHVFDVWELSTRPALLVGGDLLHLFQTVELDFGSRQLRVKRADAAHLQMARA